MSEATVRWGVLGAGGIADKVAGDINMTPGNEVVAVGARDASRAAAFAAAHGAARSYGSYEQLVADDGVDVVYIATTHPWHKEHSLLAIAAGKPVLIEKPVCLNAADAREVFDAARAAGVFAMEAMWMRCNPLVRRAKELVDDDAIGELRGVRSEFCLGVPFDPTHRLYDIANGGGALLDIGIYPATLAHLLLGGPDEMRVDGQLAPTGADDTVAMQWVYDGVPRAQLLCSISGAGPNDAVVYGTTGWIRLESRAHRPGGLTIARRGRGLEQVADPIAGQGHGYGPQIAEVARCLRAGLLESPVVPVADTLDILRLLDDARRRLGVVYPSEAGS